MKNFPFFTTQYGVASLTLHEIPYQGKAYIKILDTQEPELLVKECVDFCRMVGAEEIFASGHPFLEKYPFQTALWHMRCPVASIGDTTASLWPVQPETAAHLRRIYNDKVKRLPNSVWMDDGEEKRMLMEGDGYFVHKEGILLGIGRVKGDEIRFLASVQPGAGEDVVRALAHAITGETVVVEVASTNNKAIDLYNRLGFIKTAELSQWHKIL
jgi:hypothetical protein